jgi:cytidine deaminase
MSTTTNCDRCGAVCAYRTGHLHLSEYHRRAGGDVVSQDEYKPFDLCGGCIDELRAFLGDALVVHHYEHGPVEGEMARDIMPPSFEPAPPPLAHG